MRWLVAGILASITLLAGLGLNTLEGVHPHWWIYPPLWLAALGVFVWEITDLTRRDTAR